MSLRQRLRWTAIWLTVAAMVWSTASLMPNTKPAQTSPPSLHPSWQAQKVTQWKAHPSGERWYLQVAQATHLSHGNRTLLEKPTGVIQQKKAFYTFKADQGSTTSQSILLSGHVLLQRLTPNTPPLTLQAPNLHYDLKQRYLSTPKPVRITRGPNWIRGTGLDWWLANQVLKIRKDVISEFTPPHL